MPLQFTSGIFKIHSPSVRKRQLLDNAFREYTLAQAELLTWAEQHTARIKEQGKYKLIDKSTGEVKSEKYTDKSIGQLLPKPSEIQADLASCLKEAMVKNVAAMLASYFALEDHPSQEKTSYPTGRDPSGQDWPNALDRLVTVGCDLKAEKKARDDVMRIPRHGDFAPIHYSRSRDFALLTNKDHTRFFALLKLLPDSTSEPILRVNGDNLICISKYDKYTPGDTFSYRGKSCLLLPLEIGRHNGGWGWQYERFLKPTLKDTMFVKAGKLLKDDDDYFLHISFGMEVPPPYEPLSYLGIDRGVFFSMAYGVVDLDGRILEMNHNPDGFRDTRIQAGLKVQEMQKRGKTPRAKDYKTRELDGILHRLINHILDVAIKYQAQIVMEDLNIKNIGKFYKSAYAKIGRILEYKAALRGVPLYKRKNEKGQRVPGVWAAYSSQICTYCGELNKDRRRDGTPFVCPRCGASYHSDAGAGVNIARRAMYQAKDWGGGKGKKGDYFAFHRSFANGADF